MKDRYLTIKEVAEMLRISYDNALNYIKTCGVEYVEVGRQYRVSENKLNAFLYPKKPVKQKIGHRPIYQIVERR